MDQVDAKTFWTIIGATWGVTTAILGYMLKLILDLKDSHVRRDDHIRDLDRLEKGLSGQEETIEFMRKRQHRHANRITNLMARLDLPFEDDQ